MTELNLARIKSDVIYSLVPLLLFIVSVLYAFCRLGVFAVCNPFRWCPKSPDTDLKLEVLTPQRLFQYKKRLAEAKKAQARKAIQQKKFWLEFWLEKRIEVSISILRHV